MSAKTPIAAVLISSVSRASGAAANRATYDCRDIDVATITARITNSGTLGAACTFKVFVAHTTGATPAADAEGTGDTGWKQYLPARASGLLSTDDTRFSCEIPPSVHHLMVEFVGNTTSAVTVEAHISAASYA